MLDDELDPWLAGQVNQAETVRNALRLYKGDISTDGMEAIKASYKYLKNFMEERLENYDESFKKLDKLIEYLETRMS